MVQYNHIIDLVSELLYKHDCVIIPNFGGFVARNYGSTFSKGNNLLYPKTKHILFNKNLMHNDGLLVSALMEKSHVSYTEAEKLIADCKDYIQSLLSAKKRFEFSNIGLLYTDAENTLRFEAKADVNFLLDSFGFEPVLATELILEPETPIVTKQFEDRKAIVETPVKQKRSYVKIAALAVGLPLTLTFLLLAAGSKPMKPILESSLNPFYSPEKTYTPLNFDRKVVLFNKTKQPSLLADANGFASFTLTANGPILVAANDTIARVDKTMVTKPVYHVASSGKFDGKFQVVVGCFGVEENAEKLIRELMTKKIKAGISGTNAKGLHVVSCGGFNSKEEASSLLANIKTNYPNAWVMAK